MAAPAESETRLTGPVLVVGAGLLGTSIGLALRRRGIPVLLSDIDRRNVEIAASVEAGEPWDGAVEAQLVVVAVPPDHLGDVIARALALPAQVVTDVGSVKSGPLDLVRRRTDEAALGRYVGSHPMAGSERSGPLAGSPSLFDGRPWAITPHDLSDPDAVTVVTDLARLCGATPLSFTPEEHDRAVARTSHLPHLLAALMAGSLEGAPADHLNLSGQGVRDVTRIAGGDPQLWRQIITANADAVAPLLEEVGRDVARLLDAVRNGDPAPLGDILARGVAGTDAIPGKHGGPAVALAALFIVVPDHPGELARLLADTGESGVNVEDLRIDHDPGRPVGLVEMSVACEQVDHLQEALEDRGWTTHR
jgi:prephenate dehydrogenase